VAKDEKHLAAMEKVGTDFVSLVWSGDSFAKILKLLLNSGVL